jgi:Skp family chaperone for outer membrane proteins
MKAKIEKIILWPKKEGKKLRVVEFTMTGVEVITGKSQTGKSSLIPIVDYCLGSGKCAIPVGEIRDHAEWFGIVVKMPHAEMLLARRNPGLQAQTNEMYFDVAPEVHIPESLSDMPKTSSESVVAQLNQLAQLPSLSMTGGDEGGFTARPSFRDTAAFQFQPQHIIANPYTLFFKADTFNHQDKLKNIFPLVLGAIDGPTLEKKRQLVNLEAELNQARGDLERRRQRGLTWTQEFRSFYSQARSLGLLPDVPDPTDDWTTEMFVGYLVPVPSQLKRNPFPAVERGASRRLTREISVLRNAEDSIAKAIEDRKRKFNRVERLRSATDGYSQTLTIQGKRLQPVPWFAEHLELNHECPVCGSASESAAKELEKLVGLAKGVAASVGSVDSVNQVLDKESAALEEELKKLEDEANTVRTQLNQLEQKSDSIRIHRQTLNDIQYFGGRLEQELQKYTEADQGNSIVAKVADLERRVGALRKELDQSSIRARQDKAIDRISEITQHYAEILGVEHPERSVRIDIKNLTLAIKGEEGRQDYLWEIGSAANWMGYHVATLLALHEYFLEISSTSANPVPQFLFLDQPSQAFFPERLSDRKETVAKAESEPVSDDVTRVQRIFRALSEAITRTDKRLQIIVIDHVGEEYWPHIPNIRVVERWRGGDALIPADWLEP